MCGIVGYVGHRPACDVVIDALRRMEYRGYDSAGVALVNGRGTLTVRRRAGRLANLEAALDATDPVTLSGHSGVGHTRWATHGGPTDRNAHPHSDADGKIAVVHNGIIENFAALRRELEAAGREIRQRHRHRGRRAPGRAASTSAVTPLATSSPPCWPCCAASRAHFTLVFAQRRRAGDDRRRPALDRRWWSASATARVRRLRRRRVHRPHPRRRRARPGPGRGDHRRRLRGSPTSTATPTSRSRAFHVDWDAVGRREGRLRVLHAQGDRRAARRGRQHAARATSSTAASCSTSMRLSDQDLRDDRQGLRGRLRHRRTTPGWWPSTRSSTGRGCRSRSSWPASSATATRCSDRDTLVVAIRQSGETADTLVAVRHAKQQKAKVLAICNTNGSHDPARVRRGALHPRRAGDRGGVDQDVPGADRRQLPGRTGTRAGARHQVPRRGGARVPRTGGDARADRAGAGRSRTRSRELARGFAPSSTVLFLGRHVGYPVALEGALKLKELAYMHAEGFAAGELKHGPIALIEDGLPVSS